MHNTIEIEKKKKNYSKLTFLLKGVGDIILDRGVATLGHVTHGTSHLNTPDACNFAVYSGNIP